MGFRTEVQPEDNVGTRTLAAKLMNDNVAMTRQLRSQLPKNRDLMKKIFEYGLQPI
jgi:tryptophan halogenase